MLVYIHGGYWRALDKRDQSFVAPPFVAAGAMVVLPNYALCPAVTIEHIVLQLVQSLAWVWRHAAEHGGDPARIVVAGHSAGGHLAAMMLACDWRAVAPDLPADLVKGALAVSGVFELEPLRHAPFLAPDLNLDAATARKLSPAAMPAPRGRLVAVVGGDESEEFLRQNALIAEAWGTRRGDGLRAGARAPSHERAARARRSGVAHASPGAAAARPAEARRRWLRAAARAPPAAPADSSSPRRARASRPIAPRRGSG